MLYTQQAIAEQKKFCMWQLREFWPLSNNWHAGNQQMAEERAIGKRRKAMTVWMRQWLTRRRNVWIRTFLPFTDRIPYGRPQRLFKFHDDYQLMTLDLFKQMVENLTPYLLKQTPFMWESLVVGFELATTFHFEASGNIYMHAIMQYSSNLSRQKHNLKIYSGSVQSNHWRIQEQSADIPKF